MFGSPHAATVPLHLSGEELLTVAKALDEEALIRSGLAPEQASAVVECARWTTTYPLTRVKKHRRFEAICPMVAPALAAGSLRFTVANVRDREVPLEELDRLLREGAAIFEDHLIAEDSRLRCLVLVLPGASGPQLLKATDPSRAIKNELLKRGILVGEFFPGCPFAATFNPRLFALRSPVPMYVFRSFIESDWRFICQIPEWQRTYRERFGDPPAKLRHLGGPFWRLKQKIGWRVDAAQRRLFPKTCPPINLEA